MESIHNTSQEQNVRKARKFKSSGLFFGVGSAMALTMVVMVAVGGTYGGILAAGITGACFAIGINKFKRGN